MTEPLPRPKPKGMPAVGYHTEHQWVAAATVPVPTRIIRQTIRRRSLELPEGTWVVVLEVYCDVCRRPFDEVHDKPCHVSPWLHGGPIGERKKRGKQQQDSTDTRGTRH